MSIPKIRLDVRSSSHLGFGSAGNLLERGILGANVRTKVSKSVLSLLLRYCTRNLFPYQDLT